MTMTMTHVIDTVAGFRFYAQNGGLAKLASLNDPAKVVVHHKTGEVFFADVQHRMVRKINVTSGVITTVAGTGSGGYSGDGGLAIHAQLNLEGIAVSDDGEVYIADRFNYRIRRVDLNGIITTVAGTGTQGFNGEDGLATSIMLNNPNNVAVMDNGAALLIADSDNHIVRRVNLTTGIVSTFAGRPGDWQYNGDDIPAKNATIGYPTDIHVSPGSGNIYVLDRDNLRIRKIDRDGIISTVAGNGNHGGTMPGSLANQTSLFRTLTALGVSKDEELFILDFQNEVKMVDRNGIISRVASKGVGFADNVSALDARVNYPYGLAVSHTNEVYIADCRNSRVRRFTVGGMMTTVAGTGDKNLNTGSSIAFSTGLTAPRSVALTEGGDMLIADTDYLKMVDVNGVVTLVTANLPNLGELVVTDDGTVIMADMYLSRVVQLKDGTITRLAGTGSAGYNGDDMQANQATLNQPHSVAIHNNVIYIADTSNHRIRRVDTSGKITTVAGNGTEGYCGDEGPAVNACLSSPRGLAIDHNGNLFIADTGNHIIRKVSDGNISTYAGIPSLYGFSGDYALAVDAQLNNPRGLAVSSKGELFIADQTNGRIRKVNDSGVISTVVSGLTNPVAVHTRKNGEVYFVDSNSVHKMDANGLVVRVTSVTNNPTFNWLRFPEKSIFVFVSSVAVFSETTLIVSDSYNHLIKMVDSNGSITTIAGNNQGSLANGLNALNTKLSYPRAVTVMNHEIYLADFGNHCIRKIDVSGVMRGVAGICGNGGVQW